MIPPAFARRFLPLVLVAGGALFGVLRLYGEYVGVFVQQVPVDRVIANLEDVVAKNPKDADARNNLARAHAMAYAQKALTLPVGSPGPVPIPRGRPQPEPAPGPVWFGYEPAHAPFAQSVVAPRDDAARKTARAHLDKAIQVYREVIELAPENYSFKLGYGWCLEQAGEKAQAITVYRAVAAAAWSKEKDLRGLGLSRAVTSETAGYLIPLLDPQRDRDEIATLRERMAFINRLPRAITPVAIPLTSDLRAESLINPLARVAFDADGSGLDKTWTWITPKAGWLVWAPAPARPVTSALQMFGSVTFWMFWSNGYEAMRALDDNHDGELAGWELEGLAIWQDLNSNGVDDDGEVRPLRAWGIVALSCAYDATPSNADYSAMSVRGVTFADGNSRPTYDILLYERPERNVISQAAPAQAGSAAR
jgi:hypothetical protein